MNLFVKIKNTQGVRFSSDTQSELKVSDDSLAKVRVNDVKLPSKVQYKHKLNFKVTTATVEAQGEKKSQFKYIGMYVI